MKKTVVRLNGRVINIGPWDYQLDDDGKARNPLPEGAITSEEEVVARADGGLAAVTDYASLRRAKYPTLADQLDAIWKGGTEQEAMRVQIMAIKAEYPKA